MAKSKLDPLDYKSWGVEKYGYALSINPKGSYQFSNIIIDVENYKDGRFAGLGLLEPDSKTVYFFSDLTACDYVDLSKATLIGHVLRTDIRKLRKWGFAIDINRVHYDTALIEHLSNSTNKQYGLKHLASTKFNIRYPKYEEIIGDGDFDAVPIETLANYNGMDLIATVELFKSQNHDLKETEIYSELLWPLGFVLNAMEDLGMRLDLKYLTDLKTVIELKLKLVVEKLWNELGNINLNSPKQLLGALNVKGIVPKYKGKASVDKRALQRLESSPLISQLLGFSELETLLSSFITPLLEQGRQSETVIHPFFSQTATRTGRLACRNPNLQQIPTHTENGRKVKDAFVARPGYKFVELDYAAIEPRILAHFSKSRSLVELFKSGIDLHDFTASRMGIDRQVAKVLNLSTGYRATKYGIAYQLKCPIELAEKHLNSWWGLWPDLMLWENSLIDKTKQTGRIETLLGRKIYIDGLDSNDPKIKATAERRVIENLAQGSVSDLIGLAMIELHRVGFRLINQIHDSVLLEISEKDLALAVPRACEIMENVLILEVPIKVDAKVGENWGQMERVCLKLKIAANA